MAGCSKVVQGGWEAWVIVSAVVEPEDVAG